MPTKPAIFSPSTPPRVLGLFFEISTVYSHCNRPFAHLDADKPVLGFPAIKWFFNNVLPFKLDYLVNLNIAFVFRLLLVMMFGLIKNGWFFNIFILDRPQ